MSCSRSLIVDTLPIEKQQLGAAWCEYMASSSPPRLLCLV